MERSRGYEPRWDITLAQGERGEDYVEWLLTPGSHVEAKADQRAHETGNLIVETHQVREGYWVPSGINVTEADVWAFTLNNGLCFIVPVHLLRCLIEKEEQAGYHIREFEATKPRTRGYVIPVERMVRRLMAITRPPVDF